MHSPEIHSIADSVRPLPTYFSHQSPFGTDILVVEPHSLARILGKHTPHFQGNAPARYEVQRFQRMPTTCQLDFSL